jgi:hypothetical protein
MTRVGIQGGEMALYACRTKGHVEVQVEEEDESCDGSDHMTDGGELVDRGFPRWSVGSSPHFALLVSPSNFRVNI